MFAKIIFESDKRPNFLKLIFRYTLILFMEQYKVPGKCHEDKFLTEVGEGVVPEGTTLDTGLEHGFSNL